MVTVIVWMQNQLLSFKCTHIPHTHTHTLPHNIISVAVYSLSIIAIVSLNTLSFSRFLSKSNICPQRINSSNYLSIYIHVCVYKNKVCRLIFNYFNADTALYWPKNISTSPISKHCSSNAIIIASQFPRSLC